MTYLLFEMPSSLLCKRVGPGKYLPCCAVAFGLLTVSFAFVQSFSAAILVRALLGVAEAAQFPCTAYYLVRFFSSFFDQLHAQSCQLTAAFVLLLCSPASTAGEGASVTFEPAYWHLM